MNQWLEQHRVAVLAVLGVILVAAVGLLAIQWRQPAEITLQPPPPTGTPSPIRVYVSGAVSHPDVYSLPAGTINRDAINAAGGALPDADLNRVNLAGPLSDGQQIYVPRVGEAVAAPPSIGGSPALIGPININTATEAQLEALPHIGPAIAARIIQYRDEHGPFERIEDIQNVPGIGPATFDDIKALITVN